MKTRSLVTRLIIWQAVAMGLAWVLLTAWLVATMSSLGNGDLDRRMYTFARTLAEAASAADGDPRRIGPRLAAAERVFVEGVIQELDSGEDYVATYQVWAGDGRLLVRSRGAPTQPLAKPDGSFAERSVDGRSYRTVSARSGDGRFRVDIGEDAQVRWSSLWPTLRIIAGGQLFILVWVLLVTFLAARGGFKPLVALAAQLSRRADGDLSLLRDAPRYRELNPIVDGLNALLARERSRLETERGFLADAAHELRTPLAAVAAQAHLLSTADLPADRSAAAAELGRGIERASHLLAQLLTLARLESGHAGRPPEQMDVAEFCRQRAAAASALARSRGVILEVCAPDRMPGLVERVALGSIVDNLLDNAARYTPVGGHVLLRLSGTALGFRLEVLDDGPGIDPQLRHLVFERFYRIPGSEEPGSGPGLSIVKRMVDSQRASLRFVNGLHGRGVGFEVCFGPQG